MIWAACCTAYFGLLRVSEFTASSPNYSNSSTDLLLSDVAIDSHVVPQIIRITLNQSKTDQYRKSTHIYLGRTSYQVCPAKALIRYLDRRGGRPGPHFILPTNQLLTRVTFSEALSTIFQKLNMYPHNFNTHSFRIGAATSAKQAGISDSHIKALGRWRSNSYLKYVHMSPQTSYPSIWLQHPTHAASLPHSPTITVLSFSPHRLYIHCYRPVCMYNLFIVVL